MDMAFKLDTESCIEAFERTAPEMPGRGHDWMRKRRNRALEQLRATGMPTLKHEDWKYTDVRPLVSREYRLAGFDGDAAVDVSLPDSVNEIAGLDACRLVVVDGRFDKRLSDVDALPDGVMVSSLADAIASEPSAVEALLGKALPPGGHGFSSLNDAFVNDGVWVRVTAGVKVDRLLEIVFLVSGDGAAPLVQPRNLVSIEEGAEISMIERFCREGDVAYLNNVVTEIFVAQSARLEFCRIQEEGPRAGHVGGLFVRQQADSHCDINTVSLDGLMIRNDLRVYLDEPGAECRLNGLALGDKRQHIDNHTHVDHRAERCVSREYYKSVLDGRARSVFHGRIVVHPDAQKTDSEQQNQNLLLSRDAEVDTKPQLEIYADDVKCSHGATVGQLDEDSVFYLRTRGIDEASARHMLIVAFADSAMSGISSTALRSYMDTRIHEKLGHGA